MRCSLTFAGAWLGKVESAAIGQMLIGESFVGIWGVGSLGRLDRMMLARQTLSRWPCPRAFNSLTNTSPINSRRIGGFDPQAVGLGIQRCQGFGRWEAARVVL